MTDTDDNAVVCGYVCMSHADRGCRCEFSSVCMRLRMREQICACARWICACMRVGMRCSDMRRCIMRADARARVGCAYSARAGRMVGARSLMVARPTMTECVSWTVRRCWWTMSGSLSMAQMRQLMDSCAQMRDVRCRRYGCMRIRLLTICSSCDVCRDDSDKIRSLSVARLRVCMRDGCKFESDMRRGCLDMSAT